MSTLIPTFAEFVKRKPPTDMIVKENSAVQRKVSRLLTRSFVLNLQEPQNGKPGRRYVVKIHGDSNYVRRHLLWKLLFRGIVPLEWFILYREFEKQLKELPNCATTKYLAVLLLLSNNTRKRLPDWKSTSKSVFKQLEKCSPTSINSPSENLLQAIISEMKIPHKGESIESIYSEFIQEFYNKKPLPVRRIGVGYKDKGSLKQGIDEDPKPLQPFSPDLSIDLGTYLADSVKWIEKEFTLTSLRL